MGGGESFNHVKRGDSGVTAARLAVIRLFAAATLAAALRKRRRPPPDVLPLGVGVEAASRTARAIDHRVRRKAGGQPSRTVDS
jgi:hypothetical protein